MIQPLFNANDDVWVIMVGRYILNMNAVETATRLIIALIEGSDRTPVFNNDLAARIGFIRARFPREDVVRHKWAMNAFDVALRHAGFRNIVAHSPLIISGHADGSYQIQGIMNFTPNKVDTIAQIISLEELKGRVDESSIIGRQLLEMQADFTRRKA